MKKVLSWVLVLALVLGSFSMAFAGDTDNASNMKDAAQIKNVEAVDVMVATGIIGGYPDGNYYPEKTVTRAEMAKMISVAVNGGEDVGSYYASSCKFADSKDHWAAGYIAYCANEGIIDGRDADTFDPDTTVTGSEAAKMMLVALGYDSKIEKYVGGQWEANVLKAAKANDLFDGLEKFSAGLAVNRDNAAQIIFNGLKAVTVDYAKKDVISIGDVQITQTTKADPVKTTDADKADTMNPVYNYVELFEASFEGNLAYASGESDSFERPSHKWFYNEDKVASNAEDDRIGTYADEADYTFVVSESQKLDAATKDFDDDIKFATDNVVKINGAGDAKADATDVKVGDVVELYENTDNKVNKAVVVRHKLVEITGVDTDVTKTDAKNDITCYVYLDGYKFNDTDIAGFDAKTYVEDAYIAVAIKGTEVLASYIPEKKTGEVTAVKTDDYVKIDGTKYTEIGADFNNVKDCVKLENDVDLYVDVNGYALGAVLVEAAADDSYALITDIKYSKADTAKDSASVTLTIMGADGKEAAYKVADYEATDAPAMKALSEANCVDVKDNINYVPEKLDANVFKDSGVAIDAYLVKYTLNSKDKIDTIEFAGTKISSKATVSAKGIVDGRMISKNVSAYEYDSDDEVWTVYGYNDLLEADITGYYMMDDGEIVAILLGSFDDGSTNTVLGFYSDGATSAYKDSDCASNESKYEVALFVDGAVKDYNTVNLTSENAKFGEEKPYAILKATLNSNGLIKKLAVPTFQYGAGPLKDITEDLLAYGANKGVIAFNQVKAQSGSNIDLTSADGNNYIYVGDAKVAKISLDDGKLVMTKASVSTIKKDGYVMLLQLDEDSEAWDTVVYVSKADADTVAFKNLLDVTTLTFDAID